MKILQLFTLILLYGVIESKENPQTWKKKSFNVAKIQFENILETLPTDFQKIFDDDDLSGIVPGIYMKDYLTQINYTHEDHTVTTEDGYILGIDRITGSPTLPQGDSKKPVVLLMHGMTSSSVDWVLSGPGRSLALLLADAGYDVWLGNNRGNTWSRKHISLNPDNDTAFWDFSFHELGVYDLPAIIDHVLKETGQEKLSYVGHSQGCTQFFVLTSTLPKYNEKITVSAMLAPPVYMGDVSQPFLHGLKGNILDILGLLSVLGITELESHTGFYNKLPEICTSGTYNLYFCLLPFAVTTGIDFQQIDVEILPQFYLSYPAGGSFKQVEHYGQEIVSGYFRQYDYGSEENLVKYNQSEPPQYDLSNISAPLGLFYSLNDYLVNDTLRVAEELPNVAVIHEIEDKLFTHLDFITARDVYKLVNVYAIELIDSYNK